MRLLMLAIVSSATAAFAGTKVSISSTKISIPKRVTTTQNGWAMPCTPYGGAKTGATKILGGKAVVKTSSMMACPSTSTKTLKRRVSKQWYDLSRGRAEQRRSEPVRRTKTSSKRRKSRR